MKKILFVYLKHIRLNPSVCTHSSGLHLYLQATPLFKEQGVNKLK